VPTWSPDGAWLAFASERPRAEIIVLHVESGFMAQLTDNSAQDWRPIWRP
jgi:Tol biopolymer transport system component